jgi:hypothetical protein
MNPARLAAHLAAAAVAATNAHATVRHTFANLPIPISVNGLYLNVVTGVTNLPQGSTGTAVPGWDINPWGTTGFGLFSPTTPAGGVYVQALNTPGGTVAGNLPLGVLVGPSSVFGSNAITTTAAASGINLNSNTNIFGFRFFNEVTSAVHYGWFRVAFTDGLATPGRTLVDYAYEDTPGREIGPGFIPAPGTAALLAFAGAIASRRRRR